MEPRCPTQHRTSDYSSFAKSFVSWGTGGRFLPVDVGNGLGGGAWCERQAPATALGRISVEDGVF